MDYIDDIDTIFNKIIDKYPINIDEFKKEIAKAKEQIIDILINKNKKLTMIFKELEVIETFEI